MIKPIGVIGTFICDTIMTLDQRRIESIGGLYHSCAYLASLVEPGMVIKPFCHIGEDFRGAVEAALGRFGPQVQFDLMCSVTQPNTKVTLIYRAAETRDEITTPPMPALRRDEIVEAASFEAVIVNLISGDDIELPALQQLKTQSPLIYLDLHSLALGIDAGGRRYYREIPDWREWVEAVDILQVNEKEAATLLGRREVIDDADLLAFGKQLVAGGPGVCHITLGSRGSLVCYRHRGIVYQDYVQPLPKLPAIDIIGCGDAFGAAFLAHFLAHENIPEATRFANRIAGLNTTFMGSLTPELFQSHVKPYLKS
jgi:sugar/nucleoside kinase (ribokinase family)